VITPSVYQENVFIHSFIHYKALRHSHASPHNAILCCLLQFPASSRLLQVTSRCLRLLPLSPITSILPSTFPSITCCRRQSLHMMWPIQLAFHLFTICTIFLSSLTLCNISFLTRSVQLVFCILLQQHISTHTRYFLSTFGSVSGFSTTHSYVPCAAIYQFLP